MTNTKTRIPTDEYYDAITDLYEKGYFARKGIFEIMKKGNFKLNLIMIIINNV